MEPILFKPTNPTAFAMHSFTTQLWHPLGRGGFGEFDTFTLPPRCQSQMKVSDGIPGPKNGGDCYSVVPSCTHPSRIN